MFETAACGQALREAGDFHRQLAEQAREIAGGGFALHVRADREDDLGGLLRVNAFDQSVDP